MRGLYTILLPELRRGAEIFIEAARAEELVERARKIVEKAVAEAGDLLPTLPADGLWWST